MHRRNAPEKAIGTFKNHFKAILAGVNRTFPMHLQDWLLPQAESTLNMIHQTNIAPTVLAYAYMNGQHDYNKIPMVPIGFAALIHLKPDIRKTWDSNATEGFYLGTLQEHYQCYKVWINKHEAHKWRTWSTSNTSTSQCQHTQRQMQ